MKKNELVKFLDEYLKIDQYEDSSKNGLQVDNDKKDIKKI
jgi:putative NIF3 family GTP cyclohydrolase 1 type 2